MQLNLQSVVGSKSKSLKEQVCQERPQRLRLGLKVAISAICVATGCSTSDPTRSRTVHPVKTISTTRKRAAGNTLDVRTFLGTVEASKRVELGFQVPGVLVSLPVKEGQNVAKGGIIAQLRQTEFQTRLEIVRSQLDQARTALEVLRRGHPPEEQLRLEMQERITAAKLANAGTEFDRYARLVRSGAVSRSEYELAETNYLAAQEEHKTAVQLLEKRTAARNEDIVAQEALVRLLRSLVAEAKLQLEDSTLRAPYDGVVAQRFVDEGQSMTASKPVVRFQSVDTIDIIVAVPETVLTSGICSPDMVGIVAEISRMPGRQYPVCIKEVAQVPDPMTHAFKVRCEMKSPSTATVLPGMPATVRVSYRRPHSEGSCVLFQITSPWQQGKSASEVNH